MVFKVGDLAGKGVSKATSQAPFGDFVPDLLCHLPWFRNQRPRGVKAPKPWYSGGILHSSILEGDTSQAGSAGQVRPSSQGGWELIIHFSKMSDMVMKALGIVSCPCSPGPAPC